MKNVFMKALVCGMILGTPLRGFGQGVVYNGPHYNTGQHYNAGVVLVPLVQKVYALPDAFYSSRTTYPEDQKDELIRMMSKLINIMDRQQNGNLANAAPKGSRLKTSLGTCITCHSPSGGLKGGVDLSNPDTVSAETRVASLRAILKGSMPKGGAKLPSEYETVIEKWAAGLAVD